MLLTWARQRDCQMSFIISRGYVEVQILKNKWIWPLNFWNILICICPNSEKKLNWKGHYTFSYVKKNADTLRYHICVCNIGSAILHFRCNIKNISYSCVTNVRTLHSYFIIRIFNGCELRIENPVTTVTVQHVLELVCICDSLTSTGVTLPAQGLQLTSISKGQHTYLVSSLQMTLRKACSDTTMFLRLPRGSNQTI